MVTIIFLATEFHVNSRYMGGNRTQSKFTSNCLQHCLVTKFTSDRATGTGIGLYLIGYPMYVNLRYLVGSGPYMNYFNSLTNTSLAPYLALICVRKGSGDRTRPINEIFQPDYKHFLSPIAFNTNTFHLSPNKNHNSPI